MQASPSADIRPRATVPGSIVDGWRRALGAPWVAAGVLAIAWMFAGPLASVLGLDGPAPVAGVGERAGLAGHGLVPGLLGIDATFLLAQTGMDTTSRLVNAAMAGYLTLWAFLSGGLIDRLARARPIGPAAFFSACGGHAGRFLRLSLVTWIVYRAIFLWFVPEAFDGSQTGARVALLLLLAAVHLVIDLAKTRMVVEDRRSMFGALAASLRFARRRPLRLLALYAVSVLLTSLLTAGLSFLLPAAAPLSGLQGLRLAVVMLGMLWVRLAWVATLIAFFQRELAHAQYTAAPLPAWPDSPSVEAIRNLSR